MSTRSSIKNPSEFVRCRKTINVIYMSLFLLLIGIILLAVGSSKLNKTGNQGDLKLENIDKDVKNIIIAGIFLCSISVLVIFISSLVAVSQGCYKTGIFGLVFTFLI